MSHTGIAILHGMHIKTTHVYYSYTIFVEDYTFLFGLVSKLVIDSWLLSLSTARGGHYDVLPARSH